MEQAQDVVDFALKNITAIGTIITGLIGLIYLIAKLIANIRGFDALVESIHVGDMVNKQAINSIIRRGYYPQEPGEIPSITNVAWRVKGRENELRGRSGIINNMAADHIRARVKKFKNRK